MFNRPDHWIGTFPRPGATSHKYARGHALILASDTLTGATRLAADACTCIGAGLVTVRSEAKGDLFRTVLPPDIMVQDTTETPLKGLNSLLVGPGGFGDWHLRNLLAAPEDTPLILDAAAIAWWADGPKPSRTIILTPHDGEFDRAFPGLKGDRSRRALRAAELSQAIMVLKGAETIVASPAGEVSVNQHASPYLAKAGTGDVLAGLIAGLIAQGMPGFHAACSAVWIHGDAGQRLGPGLTAADLPRQVPLILRDLLGG